MPDTCRAEAILGLARVAFVEKGFEGASMQDLARAAGMSAGNFYRYFPSKSAIVEALIARDLHEIEDMFRAIVATPDPLAALKAGLREKLGQDCADDDALWTEISATAARKPEVAALLGRLEDGIVRRVADVLGVARGLPENRAFERFGAHARLIFLIVHGAMTSNHAGRCQDPGLSALMMRTIDWLVDDVPPPPPTDPEESPT